MGLYSAWRIPPCSCAPACKRALFLNLHGRRCCCVANKPSIPQRFAVNPRAFIVQTLSAVEIPLRTVFNLFKYLNQITDDDPNNDVPAITEFTQGGLKTPLG